MFLEGGGCTRRHASPGRGEELGCSWVELGCCSHPQPRGPNSGGAASSAAKQLRSPFGSRLCWVWHSTTGLPIAAQVRTVPGMLEVSAVGGSGRAASTGQSRGGGAESLRLHGQGALSQPSSEAAPFSALCCSIHVYQSSDNIRNRKNSMKMQHSASVTCIL